MKALIIGGTQFIGPYLVQNLVDLGHSVTVFHRGLTNRGLPDIDHIIGDRNHLHLHQEEFNRLSPDVVVDMIPYVEQHAVDLLHVFNGITGRIVAISSGDVYFAYDVLIKNESGPVDHDRLSENSKLRDRLFPYRNKGNQTYDKIPIERLILNHQEIAGTVLRLPIVYGPNDSQRRFFHYLKRMEDKRPYLLLEEGFADLRWTHGYVEDVAYAITLAVTNESAAGKTYNVGQQHPLTMFNWIAEIGKACGWDGEVIKADRKHLPPRLRFVDLNPKQSMIYDTSLIRSELGYAEMFSLQEGLGRTIEWERTNIGIFKEEDFNYALEDEVMDNIRKRANNRNQGN